jgi:hypothetical protein
MLRAKTRQALAAVAVDKARAEAERDNEIVKKNAKFVKGVDKMMNKAKKDIRKLKKVAKNMKKGNMSAWQQKRRKQPASDARSLSRAYR